jgi:hypothetical protein
MIDKFRRRVTAGALRLPLLALLANPLGSAAKSKQMRERPMNVVCHIRYEIDPYKRELFERYARTWLTVIPANGGTLIGYFMPSEGTNYVAHAMIGFDSLAAYEVYRKKLRVDPASVANFEFAQREKFIVREEREWLEPVSIERPTK